MDETDLKENVANPSAHANPAPAAATLAAIPAARTLTPQSCPTCGAAQAASAGAGSAPSYVYAIGKIAPRFPTASVEKEFTQVVGRDDTKGLTDPQVLHKILSWCRATR
jgi:hypothetical protein